MKVEILKACGVAGKNCKKGERVEVKDTDGRYLIGLGKAKQIAETEKKAAAK